MRLGVCYMGSKNAIAKEIIGVLPKARHFVDLFSGGCAVTHAAMLSGKYKRFIVNDINPVGQRVFFASIRGEARKHTGWVSREDFDAKVSTDPFVALCWSFGNNPKKGYCYAHEQEPFKNAMHEYVVNGVTEGLERYGVSKDEIDGVAEDARYPLLKELVGTRLRKRIELESLERVKALERLESLERVKALERSELFEGDYRNVAIPDDSCVYCDIPYQSTEKYADKNGGGCLFDHLSFYEWCATRDFPVFVSEYSMPEGFTRIWRKGKRKIFSATDNTTFAVESLYVQERFAAQFQTDLFGCA